MATSMDEIRKSIETISNARLKTVLLALANDAADSVEKWRENVEAWYDSVMEKAIGWYKARVQWILLFLALFVAGILNADTIAILNSLVRDPALRQAVVAAAEEYAKKAAPKEQAQAPSAGSETPTAGDEGKPDPNATGAEPTGSAPPTSDPSQKVPRPASTDAGDSSAAPDLQQAIEKVGESLKQVHALGLPLGWHLADEQLLVEGGWGWFFKFVGILLTALAVSLGAPFWFDILKKFIQVRTAFNPDKKK